MSKEYHQIALAEPIRESNAIRKAKGKLTSKKQILGL